MAGDRVRIVMRWPQSAARGHPPPGNCADMAGVTVEYRYPGPAMKRAWRGLDLLLHPAGCV